MTKIRRLSGNWIRKWDEQREVVRIFPELEKIIVDRGFEFSERDGIIEAPSILIYQGIMLRKQRLDWSIEEKGLWAEMKEDISHNRPGFLQKMDRFSSEFFYGGRDCSGGSYNTYYVDRLNFVYANTENEVCRLSFGGRLGYKSGCTIYIGGAQETPNEFFEGAESCSKLVIDFHGDNGLGKELKKLYWEAL